MTFNLTQSLAEKNANRGLGASKATHRLITGHNWKSPAREHEAWAEFYTITGRTMATNEIARGAEHVQS